MSDDKKTRLLALGAGTLADALLAARHAGAGEVVERLLATPQENVARFRERFDRFRHSRRFVDWRGSVALAGELEELLDDLRAGVTEPRAGAELVAAFYACDEGILGHCDDSSGHVGEVFRGAAADLFVAYARRCADKEWLVELVSKLLCADDYGVRDVLVELAGDYLPDAQLRALVTRFQALADKAQDDGPRHHWLRLIEALARQLRDAPLFERTRLAAWGKSSPAACLDIAAVYLQSGQAQTALTWLEKVPFGERFKAAERDALLLTVHGALGNAAAQAEVAWRLFRRARSPGTLEQLLAVIGPERRDAVVAEEEAILLGEKHFTAEAAAFLLAVGRHDAAEAYLLRHAADFNGDFYQSLLPLAETLATLGRPLVASLLYRALLDSILRRARSTIYHHGVRYLRKLDLLAQRVSDWRGHSPHPDYTATLFRQHCRKKSFWADYEG